MRGLRLNRERPRPRLFLDEPDRGHHARRARRPLRVDLVVPLGELALQILVVDEATLLEEGSIHPADEVLHAPVCSGLRGQPSSTPRPRSSATAPKIGFQSVTLPSCDHLSAIVLGRSKTASSGRTAPRREVIGHRAYERLDALALDENTCTQRELQPRREEVHAPRSHRSQCCAGRTCSAQSSIHR